MRRRKRRNRTGIYLVMLVAALFVGTLAVHGYSLRANCQKLATEQQNLKDKKKSLKKEQEQIAKNEVSRDFFKTPMRKLMAFIIQQPTVVSNVQREFALDEFVALCKRLGVKGADELEGLLKIIAKTPDITPAKFIEQTRQTSYEKIVRLLIGAPLNLTFESGGEIREIPYVDRIEYFADILSEVITKPLKDRAKILSVEMSQGKMDALSEYTQIQKEILSKDLKS